MPRIIEQILMICGVFFLIIAAFLIITTIIEMIKDSIYLYRDKKYGFCPLIKDICNAGGKTIHNGTVMKCFDCPYYMEWQEDQMERGSI